MLQACDARDWSSTIAIAAAIAIRSSDAMRRCAILRSVFLMRQVQPNRDLVGDDDSLPVGANLGQLILKESTAYPSAIRSKLGRCGVGQRPMRFLDDRQVHQAAALGRDATVIGEPNDDQGRKECPCRRRSDQNRMQTRRRIVKAHTPGNTARFEYCSLPVNCLAPTFSEHLQAAKRAPRSHSSTMVQNMWLISNDAPCLAWVGRYAGPATGGRRARGPCRTRCVDR